MKKSALFLLVFSLFPVAFPQEKGGLFFGSWQNSSRKIEFSEGEIKVFLRSFYGLFEENPVKLKCAIETEGGAAEIQIFYEGEKEAQTIFAATDEQGVFLDFCVKGSAFFAEKQQENQLLGFWRPASNCREIGVSSQKIQKELTGFYFFEGEAYKIRYWLADLEGDDSQAELLAGDDTFFVDKFLQIGGKTYTCVQGQGLQIRNAKMAKYRQEGAVLQIFGENETQSLRVLGDFSFLSSEKPYLTRE